MEINIYTINMHRNTNTYHFVTLSSEDLSNCICLIVMLILKLPHGVDCLGYP